ncbi:Crp/Fnr family transcriptional regulator [Fulvivirga sp. 29W222]|uniref:Crp/Fnr family transcriptional regulator n=1 Tax=Fulvivirga marina TaxID=2494733 RepID=A0A937FX65_9BACT|nr:cyclic nucleotide-binding domain-containing protein [Fulvivirga marina]MBL6446668.1 Crp/Fnr family transcriptional regulator [Fulvivirga marina]
MTRNEADLQIKSTLQNIIGNHTAEIEDFVQNLSVIQMPKSGFLVRDEDKCSNIYFINQGAFRTFLQVEGRETNTEFFFENSFAGAFTSFLLDTRTSLNIQAMEPAVVMEIPKVLLERYYQINPCWYALGKYIFEREFIKKCQRESDFLAKKGI